MARDSTHMALPEAATQFGQFQSTNYDLGDPPWRMFKGPDNVVAPDG